ncbi:MAG TPA: tyrosine-type recombinase/integrase [Methanomassiliicoccales archaeon]
MPSKQRYLEQRIDSFLAKKTARRRLSKGQAGKYRGRLLRLYRILDKAGLETKPKQFGDKELDFLLAEFERLGWSICYQKQNICVLNQFLLTFKNPIVRDAEIGWPSETRQHVDWLTEEEAIGMIDASVGVERIVIHLELRLWLRRIEVERMLESFLEDAGIVAVHGKGRGGGKFRNLAWGPDTLEEVQRWEELREALIEKARRKDPDVDVPKAYIIYERGGKLAAYGHTAIDNIVQRVAKRAGIQRPIGNHTLRRTGARLAYFAGVPMVEIMEALGHTSEKQTIRYLGLTVLELAKMQRMAFNYLEQVRARMQGKASERTKEASQPEPLPVVRVST